MKTTEDLIDRIKEKASQDAEFKELLIKDPVKTIESFSGLKLDDIELNEEQLENVSGGGFGKTVYELIELALNKIL